MHAPVSSYELSLVPVLGERRDRDVCDVVDVDERLADAVDRQRDLALDHRLEE